MQTLDNVETQDEYAPPLTLEQETGHSLLAVVANASVRASLLARRRETGGDQSWSTDFLLTPQTVQVGNVRGVRFKSAVPGEPARVVAFLAGDDDPQIAAGTPFLAQLTAAGDLVGGALQLLSVNSNSGALVLTAAFQAVTGDSIVVAVVGANAKVLFVANFDFSVTAPGIANAIGAVFVDGGQVAPLAVCPDVVARGSWSIAGLIPVGPGVHTFELRVRKNAAGGAATLETGAGNTQLNLLVQDA